MTKNIKVRCILIWAFTLTAVGCTSLNTPMSLTPDRPIITRGIVINTNDTEVLDIKVRHMPTRTSASFSSILPRQRAEIGFSSRKLLAEEAELSWVENGIQRRVKLILEKSLWTDKSDPLTLVYQLLPGNRATVQLISGD